MGLGSEHVSPYQLTIEPSTAFGRAARNASSLIPPPEGLAADLYETTQETLSDLGFEAYEVSNHASGPASRSRHNMNAWRGQNYLGVGPGAAMVESRLIRAGSPPRLPAGSPTTIDRVRRRSVGGQLARQLDPRQVGLERPAQSGAHGRSEGVATAELSMLDLGPARLAELDEFAKVKQGRLIATERGRRVLDRLLADLALADGT